MAATQRAFAVWWKDLERWVLPARLLSRLLLRRPLPSGWSYIRVSELVQQVEERVKVETDKEYNLIGVKWYGEGTFFRETVRGDSLSAAYLTPVIPDAFIYNRLFAWKGSFAVVPEEHRGCFVSNEFPQFIVDERRILPRYLYLFFMCNSTIKAVDASSIGSAAVSRNRFKEDDFLSFEIPLPPIPVQWVIVRQWEKVQEEMQNARTSLQKIKQELNSALYEYYYAHCKEDILKNRWLVVGWADMARWDVKTARASAFRIANPSFKPLSEFAEEATELVKPWEEPEKEWPVYGVNNKEGVFFSHCQKGKDFNAAYKRIRKDWFFHNPTRSSVGSLGIVPHVPDDALTSPEYQVWRIKRSLIPGYVAVLVSTPFFVNLIQFHRVGAVKQRLYVENLLEIRVPIIAPEDQRRVAEMREAALQRIAEVETKAANVRREIQGMILGTRPVPEVNGRLKISA